MIEPLRILQTTPQLTASIQLKVPREEEMSPDPSAWRTVLSKELLEP